jgi:hypothetical protein
MLVSYYQPLVSPTLQHAQAITILKRIVALGQGSSSFSHIIASALPTQANL